MSMSPGMFIANDIKALSTVIIRVLVGLGLVKVLILTGCLYYSCATPALP